MRQQKVLTRLFPTNHLQSPGLIASWFLQYACVEKQCRVISIEKKTGLDSCKYVIDHMSEVKSDPFDTSHEIYERQQNLFSMLSANDWFNRKNLNNSIERLRFGKYIVEHLVKCFLQANPNHAIIQTLIKTPHKFFI